MSFGLGQNQIDFIDRTINGVIFPQQTIKIWIFGSRARGDFSKYSDIDLLLEAQPVFTTEQKDRILTLFQESDLPFIVDLVFLETLEPSYRGEILKERRPLMG